MDPIVNSPAGFFLEPPHRSTSGPFASRISEPVRDLVPIGRHTRSCRPKPEAQARDLRKNGDL